MDKPKDLNTFINTSPSHLEQFENFLTREGLNNQLEFVWAVQGLKSESVHLGQIIRTIYKHFFEDIHVSDNVRSSVKNQISNGEYSLDIFDQAVEEVWRFLDSVVYQDFLTLANHHESPAVAINRDNFSSSNNNNSSTGNINNNLSSTLPATTTTTAQTSSCSPPLPLPSSTDPTSSCTNTLPITICPEPPPGGGGGSGPPSSQSPPPPTILSTTTASSSATITAQQPPISSSSASSTTSTTNNTTTTTPSIVTTSLPTNYQYQQSSSSVPKINLMSLEPLMEGQELRNKSSTTTNANTANVLGLTRKALEATQKIRSGIDLGGSCKQKSLPYHYPSHCSYNPVSRQDSEVQSFSSGCLTDTEPNIETRIKRRCRKELNCDNLGPPMLTRPPQKSSPEDVNKNPEKFFQQVVKKLEEYIAKRNSEARISSLRDAEEKKDGVLFAKALREKLHLSSSRCQDETQPDDILDNHVSRVWADVTPDSSHSPPGRREYKRNKAPPIPACRRIHAKDQDHQIPKSKTFPSAAKYDHDSGISITTTSTCDDFFQSNALSQSSSSSSSRKISTKNAMKAKSKKEISCIVFYRDQSEPFSFKIPFTHISLGLFKEKLPVYRQGNYRYYFKCNPERPFNKEIIRDEEPIPIFEGKIIAHLQPVQPPIHIPV